MKAIERHRQTWQGKSDEWLFERLDNELKQKVDEIRRLLAENEALRMHAVVGRSEQLKALFEKLLNENMCSVAGDELIEDALKAF
jgi:hypothetical protein